MKLDFPEVLIIALTALLAVLYLQHEVHRYRLRHPQN